MRRPSRQGLIPVCKPGTDTITADVNLQGRCISGAIPSAFFYCVFILLSSSLLSCAQTATDEIQQYFDLVRTNHHAAYPPAFLTALPGNDMIILLESFLNDSSTTAREKAYELVCTVSSMSSDSSLRKKGVLILLKAFDDRNPGIRTTVVNLLQEYNHIDFNLSARKTLSKMVTSKVTPLDRLVKLGGFLNLTELIPVISAMAKPGNPPRLRWAALQSLARMGEAYAIEDMLQRAKRLPVNDNLVYKVFPDLIFTRRREAIAYVVEALRSDEKNCLSADIERETAIHCGYRIMEQLASVIEGFPFELDDAGDLRTDDYGAALQTARQWFDIHENYKINHDRY